MKDREETIATSTDSAALIRDCKAGITVARERLCTDHSSRIYRWAVWLGLDRAEAEDATQEVLVIALRLVGELDEEAALAPWLYQISRRVVANVRKKAWWRRVRLVEQDMLPAFDVRTIDPETELAVRSCLLQVPTKLREVLVLMEIEGHARDQVAAMLSIPPGTVASRLRLAKAAFKKLWEERESAAPGPRLLEGEP